MNANITNQSEQPTEATREEKIKGLEGMGYRVEEDNGGYWWGKMELDEQDVEQAAASESGYDSEAEAWDGAIEYAIEHEHPDDLEWALGDSDVYDFGETFGAWVKALKERLLELGIREHSMGLCVCYGYYYCADGGQAGVDAMLREWYAVGWTVETAAREIIHRHDLLHPERDENFGTEARAMRFLTWSVEVAVAMDRLGYVPGTGARAIPNREKRIGWYMAAYDMEWTPLRAAQTLHQLDWADTLGDEGENVLGRYACPACGNDLADKLVWADDETVRCEVCGVSYEPIKG